MSNNLSNIPPSIEELKRWQQGQFPLGQRHDEIQHWLDTDPFLQEAMEGMRLDPEFKGFQQKIPKTPSHKSHFKGWVFGLVIGLGCALLAVSIWNPLAPDNKMPIVVSTPSATASPARPLDVPAAKKQEEKHSNPSTSSLKLPSETIESPLAEKTLTPIPAREGALGIPIDAGKPLRKINACIDVHGYAVYPYKERAKKNEIMWTGIPADNGSNQEAQKSVSYLSYLEEAIIAFQENDWDLAEEHCNTILQQYPDDINALYLKAKCIFNTKRIGSLALFEKTAYLSNGRLNEKEIAEYIRLAQ
jgi:hypothetical protein